MWTPPYCKSGHRGSKIGAVAGMVQPRGLSSIAKHYRSAQTSLVPGSVHCTYGHGTCAYDHRARSMESGSGAPVMERLVMERLVMERLVMEPPVMEPGAVPGAALNTH